MNDLNRLVNNRIAVNGRERQFSGGIGMNKAAAHGAAIAGLNVADPGQCLRDQWQSRSETLIVLDITLAGAGAHADGIGGVLHTFQRSQSVDVHQHRGPGKTHGHHRHQALAACHELGVSAMLLQDLQRVSFALGADVVERGCFHGYRSSTRKALAAKDDSSRGVSYSHSTAGTPFPRMNGP
jgi:hypothetical protein